jgi:hypothetical protein
MYWIIGRDNPRQPPALAMETYDDNGAPISLRELATFKDPFVDACEVAATLGVPADRVAHDEDSTDMVTAVPRRTPLPRWAMAGRTNAPGPTMTMALSRTRSGCAASSFEVRGPNGDFVPGFLWC